MSSRSCGRDEQPEGFQSFAVGSLDEKDLVYLIPVLRQWIRKDGRVIEEEFNAVLEKLQGNLRGKDANVYLVLRDEEGHALGVMGFGEVNDRMALYRSAPGSKAAGLLTAFMSPGHRGEGMGAMLMKALFARAREAGWTEMIWSSNPRYRETAWRFYTHMAGEPVGMIDDLFEKGTSSPVWRKSL